MTDEALLRYAHDLAAEVEDSIQAGADSIYSEEEFTRIVLDKLANESALDNPTFLYQEGTFGRTRYKITGFSIPDTEDRILLVTTVYTAELPPRRLTADEIKTAITQAVNFYKCSCDGLYEKIEPSNTEAGDLARRVFEINDHIDVLRVVLLSDGLAGLKSLDVKGTKDGTRVLVDMYGIERLHRVLGEGLTRDDIVLDFTEETGATLRCLRASSGSADYEAYLTVIPGVLLADIYEKYGTHLLELNVRAFLGVRGRKSVNAGLRRTIQEEPARFLAYNNGIVATADEIELEEGRAGVLAIKALRGLQIVNGGQTTASLHRARKHDRAQLESISVPAKIIRVKPDSLDSMVTAVGPPTARTRSSRRIFPPMTPSTSPSNSLPTTRGSPIIVDDGFMSVPAAVMVPPNCALLSARQTSGALPARPPRAGVSRRPTSPSISTHGTDSPTWSASETRRTSNPSCRR